MTPGRKNIRIAVAILALLFLLWGAGLISFMRDLDNTVAPVPDKKLDAAVVLTGGTNRIDTGFTLIKQGFAKKLFISGVYRTTDVKQLLKRWKAEPQQYLDCCVMLGFEATDTVGNAVETVDWLRKENFHSLYLVTANYHMRRSLVEFSRLAPDLAITPFPVVPDRLDDSVILREYMKYLAAYFRSFI